MKSGRKSGESVQNSGSNPKSSVPNVICVTIPKWLKTADVKRPASCFLRSLKGHNLTWEMSSEENVEEIEVMTIRIMTQKIKSGEVFLYA